MSTQRSADGKGGDGMGTKTFNAAFDATRGGHSTPIAASMFDLSFSTTESDRPASGRVASGNVSTGHASGQAESDDGYLSVSASNRPVTFDGFGDVESGQIRQT